MTVSCDIGLAPKQTVELYELSNLYGQCKMPSRSSGIQSSRKKRNKHNDENFSRITLRKTIDISSRKSKETSNAFGNHLFSISLIVISMVLL